MLIINPVELCSVKDCDVVFSHQNTVILSGRNPWIFRKDGTFVAHLKTIRNAYRVAFLPRNMALMESSVNRAYFYVSLDNGKILWRVPQKGKRSGTPNQFAVSQDGRTVYYVYQTNSVLHIDVIVPELQTCTTYAVPMTLRATYFCFCDDEENLCMLQGFREKRKRVDGTETTVFVNAIMKWNEKNPIPVLSNQWTNEFGTHSVPRICNDQYVLYSDFSVVSIHTRECLNLLQNNDPIACELGGFVVEDYDPSRHLLTVRFLSSWSSVIVDCIARKIVAHYLPVTPGLSGGKLIDNEFWLGSKNGIQKKPFPHMDTFPHRL